MTSITQHPPEHADLAGPGIGGREEQELILEYEQQRAVGAPQAVGSRPGAFRRRVSAVSAGTMARSASALMAPFAGGWPFPDGAGRASSPARPARGAGVSLPRRVTPGTSWLRPATIANEACSVDLTQLTDEQLIERSREVSGAEAQDCLQVLYRRFYPRVSYWCWKICGDREQATDLAQDVFLRVHSRIGSFRFEARFSTWLYQVTRSVAINRGMAARLRRTASLDEENRPDIADDAPSPAETVINDQIVERFRQAIARDLEPLEARILYLHYADGLTVDGITALLGLANKSGAKAYLVSAKRKLKRRFGRWLEVPAPGGAL